MSTQNKENLPRTRRAKDETQRENQLVNLAVNLAEKQLKEGSASSQVITHYLKIGSTKEKLEKKKLERDIELMTAKTETIKSEKRSEEVYEKALAAMKEYQGAG
jgi:hypothetical protein